MSQNNMKLAPVLTAPPPGDTILTAEALAALRAADKAFARIIDRHGLPAARRLETGFAGLVQIVVSQQVSTQAAKSIHQRLHDVLKQNVSPARFLKTPEDKLRAAGLSGPKIQRCYAIAEAVKTGAIDLDDVARMTDDAAIAALTGLKGIGRWSAEIYLLFGLGRTDIFPAGDLALQVGAQIFKNLRARPDEDKLRRLAKPWQPWRSAASRLLWHGYGAAIRQDKTLV